MDTRGWKKILLQWITECNFMERNYFNIEQSDIEAFFQNFCQHSHFNEAGASTSSGSVDLAAFLQEYYPDFEPHFDDNYALSSSDYIYVYSLLLHFSCVKFPELYFHEICQKLSEHSQQSIATFFKQLVDCSNITKDVLRRAIAEVTLLSPRSNESFTSNCGGLPSPSFARLESPIRTPKRSSLRVSPTTPKTVLLEERTRELYNLRASLETERYEKGLLEVQIKQNEDKILQLNQDHRKLQQQIQDLKNDILSKNTENSSPNREDDDQIKRRLCKEISQKEQEISKLTDIISALREEKSLVQEKLSYADKNIVFCMERIKELDFKVDELTTELEQKNGTIKYLTDNKLELEQFISETRSASSSSRPDFNMSMDCLDASFSRTTNSSGSQSSPENLGCSVVDIQLREKEIENIKLREDISIMRLGNNKLARHIQQLSEKHSLELEISIENVTVNDDENVDPAEHFVIFSNCVDKLSKLYKDERNTVEKLQQETVALEKCNEELNKRVQQFEADVCEMKNGIQSLEFTNETLSREKSDLQAKLVKCENEIELLNKQKLDLVGNLDSLSTEYEAHKLTSAASQKELADKIDKLNKDLAFSLNEIESFEKTNNQMKKNNEDLHAEIDALKEKLKSKTEEFELEVKSLNERLSNKAHELETHKTAELMVKDKYEKLLIQCEDMKKTARDADDHLDTMRNQLAIKELEMSKLGTEIIDVRSKNIELEQRIDTLMNKYKQEKQTSEMTISEKDNEIKESQMEREKLSALLENTQKKQEQVEEDFNRSKQELQDICLRVESLKSALQISLEEASIANTLDEFVRKVQELVDYKTNAVNKLESLQLDNIDCNAKLKLVEYKLKQAQEENVDIIKKHEDTILQFKTDLNVSEEKIKEYEEHLQVLKRDQKNFIEKLEKQLQCSFSKNVDTQHIEEELKAEQEDYKRIERELILVIGEHNFVHQRLIEAERKINEITEEKHSAELSYNNKIKTFKEVVEKIETQNNSLIEEIKVFKQEHEKTETRLKSANTELEELSKMLNEESSCKNQLNLKLKDSEIRLHETEMKLDSIMREKSSTINDLQSTFENQLECLKKAKTEQMSQIEELQEQLKIVSGEKENLIKSAANVAAQIKREQDDKAVLLRSLEKTADQLKQAVEEKSNQAVAMEKRCAELEEKYSQVNELNTQLQSDLVSKEAEFSLQLDEFENERMQMQNKLSELIRKMAKQSESLESNDLALTEIVALLENNANITAELRSAAEVKNLFNAEPGIESHYNQLKQSLNRLVYNISYLQQQVDECEGKRQEASDCVDILTETNEKLNNQIKQNKAEIEELQEMLNGEAKSLESKLSNEIKRLNEDLQNLENVNEKLTGENASLQLKLSNHDEETENFKLIIGLLTEQRNKLLEDEKFNEELIQKLKAEEKKLNENLREKQSVSNELQEKCSKLEVEIKEKSAKITNLTKDLRASNEQATELDTQLQKLHEEVLVTQNGSKQLIEKYHSLQEVNESLEKELSDKNKEIVMVQAKITEVTNANLNLKNQLEMVNARLDEFITMKLSIESKYDALDSQMQQLQRDYEFSETRLHSTLADMDKLMSEIASLKNEKLSLHNEIKDSKRDLQRANDNVSELIQQIASIRFEKDSVVEENQLLRKQLEENGKYQTTSESKLKSIIERSQTLELSLLASENELKSIKSHLEKSEKTSEKLVAENKKLRESQEASTKRVEKLALKLGDSQARCAKFERENDKLTKTNEAANNSMEALRREKDTLQADVQSLKERLSHSERAQEQLASKLQTLEQSKAALEEAKQKLETFELDGKSKLTKLEKMRETNEEKIRKLNQALNNSEQTNVRLNLEIGALNSQLNEVRRVASVEKIEQVEEIQKNLDKVRQQAEHYEKLNVQLEAEAEKLREENSTVADKLSKVSVSLQITKEKCDVLKIEMQQLRTDFNDLRAAKRKLDEDHLSTLSSLKELEAQKRTLVEEKQTLVADLESQVAKLQTELASKTTQISELQTEVDALRARESEKSERMEVSAAQAAEMENIRTRLAVADALLEKEQTASAQLRLDNQILQVKYREAKQKVIDESKASEDRIKENRLELEGKLEKMKNKMKTLYTEEITKMKVKQERETAGLKSEMEVLKAQNVKYEEHTRKLSSQMVRLNDKILEHQKQNAILTTKLKHMEDNVTQQFKRPNSIHVSSLAAAPTNIGTNLAMEDEEGEVFNNTYLTDLKAGRMSELMSRDICAEELQYRNSLLPPHLKSTYAAQYDHGMAEDDLKDGPHSLDDSMSALLSTTVGGTRKKVTGATSYKRPGPPTPSKNGGRLSFGGTSEPAREILKESYDGNAAGTSSAKTPARFKIFSSRFSMGNTKDEASQPTFIDLRKAVHQRNFQLIRMAGAGAVCTSTPRKSKAHFDHRRLLDRMLLSSPSPTPSPLAVKAAQTSVVPQKVSSDKSFVESTPLTSLIPTDIIKINSIKNHQPQPLMKQRRFSRKFKEYLAADTTTSVESPGNRLRFTPATTSSGAGLVTSLQRRLRRRPRRERGTRPSIYLRGNIFAKYRTPPCGGTYRDLFRRKARKQRMENFNQFRMMKSFKKEDLDERKDATFDKQNNNYTHFNRNQEAMGRTMVIVKKEPMSITSDVDDDVVENVIETDQIDSVFSVDGEEFDDESNADVDYDDSDDDDDYEIIESDVEEIDLQDSVNGEEIVVLSAIPQKIKAENNEEKQLVTTLDLVEFDKRNLLDPPDSREDCERDDHSVNSANSKHFEQLLAETESNAPFEVKKIQFELTDASSLATVSSSIAIPTNSSTTQSSIQQQNSPASVHLSRTIYGGSVIYNRKIPNVNTTFVRKSSIYVKNNKDSTMQDDIILVTNQTITLLDLARMWKQMDRTSSIFVAFAVLASFTTIICLFLSFFYSH